MSGKRRTRVSLRRHCCFMYFCEINEKFNTKCDKISQQSWLGGCASAHTHIHSAQYKAAAVLCATMMAKKSVFMKL